MPLFTFVSLLPNEGEEEAGQGFDDGGLVIPAFSVFVGNGYMRHASARQKAAHVLQYHTYVIPERRNLKEAEGFSYGGLLGRWEGSASGSPAGWDYVQERQER